MTQCWERGCPHPHRSKSDKKVRHLLSILIINPASNKTNESLFFVPCSKNQKPLCQKSITKPPLTLSGVKSANTPTSSIKR